MCTPTHVSVTANGEMSTFTASSLLSFTGCDFFGLLSREMQSIGSFNFLQIRNYLSFSLYSFPFSFSCPLLCSSFFHLNKGGWILSVIYSSNTIPYLCAMSFYRLTALQEHNREKRWIKMEIRGFFRIAGCLTLPRRLLYHDDSLNGCKAGAMKSSLHVRLKHFL